MALKLSEVIPVGRRLIEYQGMFHLTMVEIKDKTIIDCGGGPSSFNDEATKLGGRVTSIDPIYAFSKGQIASRIQETFDPMMEQVKDNQDMFVWNHISNYQALYDYRQTAMALFLDDYDLGQSTGRYTYQCLPSVNCEDKTYDIALCSHLLFLYSDQLDETFHYDSILEMLRIASDVRIFPIIDLSGKQSIHLNPIMKQLSLDGYNVKIVKAEYEFLKGAKAYLSITQ